MSNQVGFTVDVNQCISCRSCEVACKVEYDLQAGEGRRRRVSERTVDEGGGTIRTFFISLACNHCVNPACVAACPDITRTLAIGTEGGTNWPSNEKALFKDDASGTYSGGLPGVVRLNKDKCIACRRCEWACPYGAPQFNPNGGGLGVAKVHKCEFCWQRISAWKTAHPSSGPWNNPTADISDKRRMTACAATCLGRALHSTLVDPTLTTEDYGTGGGATKNYVDYLDYRALGGAPASPTAPAPLAARTFAAPGGGTIVGTSAAFPRGSHYLTHYSHTLPAIKLCDRLYKTRSGVTT